MSAELSKPSKEQNSPVPSEQTQAGTGTGDSGATTEATTKPPEPPVLEVLAEQLDPTSDQFDNAYVKHPNKSELKIPIRHPMVTAFLVSKFYQVAGVLPTTGQKEMFLVYLEGKAWANRKDVDPSDWATSELEQEPLVTAIVALVQKKKEFEGTREQLADVFKDLQSHGLLDKATYLALPNTLQKLSTTLSRIAPALAQIGIVVERSRTASERTLKIYVKPAA